MRIEFDAQLLLDQEMTGIAVYARHMTNELYKYGHEIQYDLFRADEDDLQKIKKEDSLWGNDGRRHIQNCRKYSYRAYKLLSMFLPLDYSRLFGGEADAAIFFNYVIPPGVKAGKIAVIHDMAYLDCPETVRKRTLFHLKHTMRAVCRQADLILTVSEFSRRRVIHHLKVKEEQTAVVPCGIDFKDFHCSHSEQEIVRIKQKYGISGEYYLYVGTLEPRKNVERLLVAYSLLKKEIRQIPKLVLAGRKGWMYERMFRLVDKLMLKEDIIFTGYIGREEKPILMQGAKIFVFPSLYEGFGIPVLEAMACGTAVLTSACAAMPEVVGDAGWLADPHSVNSIKDGLLELERNERKRRMLAEKGYQRSRRFSWEVSGRKLNEILLRNFKAKEG